MTFRIFHPRITAIYQNKITVSRKKMKNENSIACDPFLTITSEKPQKHDVTNPKGNPMFTLGIPQSQKQIGHNVKSSDRNLSHDKSGCKDVDL